jgi:hypothetical protein
LFTSAGETLFKVGTENTHKAIHLVDILFEEDFFISLL